MKQERDIREVEEFWNDRVEVDEGWSVEAVSGWTWTVGEGEWTRTVFVRPSHEQDDADSLAATLVVSEGSAGLEASLLLRGTGEEIPLSVRCEESAPAPR